MPTRNWILTDVARKISLESFYVSAGEGPSLTGSDKWAVTKSTLRGGLSEGVDVVELNNGRLSVSILPTRGMGLWKGTCDGLELGWKSPVVHPVNPAFVNAVDRSGLGWLSGFNEWMCRCGLDSNGAPGTDVVINNQGNPQKTELTLHGKIANIPAYQVEVAVSTDDRGTISVTGVVDEAMLFGPALRLKSTVQTVAGSNRLMLIDEVTNLRGLPAELELLYHTNMGAPFLEQDSRLVAPVIEVAPRDARAVEGIDGYSTYSAPTAGFVEQAYWFDLAADKDGRTQVLLRNAHGDKGISLHFSKKQLPCFTLWKNTQAEADGYVTGLEPGTNYPNLKTFERKQGRVITLPPGGKYEARLEIAIHSTANDVLAAEKQITVLQKGHEPRVHRQPQAKYSSG